MSALIPVATYAVLVFGCLIVALCAWGIAKPDRLMNLVTSALDQRWGMIFGVGIRLLLGAALIIAAPSSKFPVAFTVLGWVAIIAAIGLLVMGPETVRKLIDWFGALQIAMLRGWLLFGMAFGAFLIAGSW